MRKFGLDHVDDRVRRGSYIGADRDHLRLADTSSLKNLFASAIAEIDSEAELLDGPHARRGVIDDRAIRPAGQQELRGDLTEAREADHPDILAGPIECLVYLFGRFRADQKPAE